MWPPPEYRACMLCDHGATQEGNRRVCMVREVTGGRQPVPVGQARQLGGARGPEAKWLVFPGLRTPILRRAA